jgi:hypothetical protein
LYSFTEDDDEEARWDGNFFKLKNIKERLKVRFSEVAKCVLITPDQGKDILEYFRSNRMTNAIPGLELTDRLNKAALSRDYAIGNAYYPLAVEYGHDKSLPSMLNHDLVRVFMSIFNLLIRRLQIPDSFGTNLLKYLVDNFRWVVPVVKTEEDFLLEAGEGAMEQPF